MNIRPARDSDIPDICAFDQIAQTREDRRAFIEESVRSGITLVSTINDKAVAYAVLNHDFYDNGFIEMLYVQSEHRRAGHGSSLVHEIERVCRTQRLFTSTNESNGPMQVVLKRLGYQPSGVIYNLDPGDPELIYFKLVR